MQEVENEEGSNPKSKERYESALQLLIYEGNIGWQINVLFVGFNIGIGTIMSTLNYFPHHIGLIVLSLLGLLVNSLWLATFLRNSRYYNLRMSQLRSAEPSHWNLVNDVGRDFSQGKKVLVAGDPASNGGSHKLGFFPKFVSNKKAIQVPILCLAMLFGSMAIVFWQPHRPQWLTTPTVTTPVSAPCRCSSP